MFGELELVPSHYKLTNADLMSLDIFLKHFFLSLSLSVCLSFSFFLSLSSSRDLMTFHPLSALGLCPMAAQRGISAITMQKCMPTWESSTKGV